MVFIAAKRVFASVTSRARMVIRATRRLSFARRAALRALADVFSARSY